MKRKLTSIFITLSLLAINTTPTNASDTIESTQSVTQIVLLGAGTPNADPERSGPAVAIVVNNTPYLIDCGPGIVRRAAAAANAGIEGLKAS